MTINGTGVWVSRRHTIYGTGTVTAPGKKRHDVVVLPLDESQEDRLSIANHGGGFNEHASAIQETLTEAIPQPDPPPITSTLQVGITATQPPAVGALTALFTSAPSGGTGPYAFVWDFGDGGVDTAQNTSHTYATAGSYTVTVSVTDATGFVRVSSLAVYASLNFGATLTSVPIDGSAPLTVQLTATPANGTAPYSYLWEFGDGSTSTLQNPIHTYTSAGEWIATVGITDATPHSIDASITIEVVLELRAEPLAIPNIGPVDTTTTFLATPIGGHEPYTYQWDFGDGFISTLRDPYHTFETIGFYNVRLVILDSYGRVFETYVAVNIGPVTLTPPIDDMTLDLTTQPLATIYGWVELSLA